MAKSIIFASKKQTIFIYEKDIYTGKQKFLLVGHLRDDF